MQTRHLEIRYLWSLKTKTLPDQPKLRCAPGSQSYRTCHLNVVASHSFKRKQLQRLFAEWGQSGVMMSTCLIKSQESTALPNLEDPGKHCTVPKHCQHRNNISDLLLMVRLEIPNIKCQLLAFGSVSSPSFDPFGKATPVPQQTSLGKHGLQFSLLKMFPASPGEMFSQKCFTKNL